MTRGTRAGPVACPASEHELRGQPGRRRGGAGLHPLAALHARAVREEAPYRLKLVLLVVGIVELAGFADDHRMTVAAWALVGGGLAVGAGFGVARGATVRIWRRDGVLLRQGNPVTVVLWVIGLGVHGAVDLAVIALAAQRLSTLNRARHLAAA
jgi:hypothetical protein